MNHDRYEHVNTTVSIKDYHLLNGVRCITIEGAHGLSFTIVPDRALDIADARFLGRNISFLDRNGIQPPERYGTLDKQKETNFFFGLLSTCGLGNTGPSCIDEGVLFGLHGDVSNQRADDVVIERTDDKIEVSGDVWNTGPLGMSFRLHRKIRYQDDIQQITVEDTVENASESRQQLCIMYHYNFGYPFLSEALQLSIGSDQVVPRDAEAQKYQSSLLEISPPTESFLPQVFYHSFHKKGWTSVSLHNPDEKIRVELSFNTDSLPCMNHWKMFRPNRYVLSFEPCNAFPYGRVRQRQENIAKYLESQEQVTFHTRVRFSKTE